MKKYTLFFILFTTISIFSKAQNLQFSKVIYLTLQGTPPNNNAKNLIDTISLVVPANKVVKLESVCANPISNGFIPDEIYVACITLNGIALTNYNTPTTGYSRTQELFPIWLPEGQYKFALVATESAINRSFKGHISGIEYTISK
jgi:hypothetical protein